MIGNGNVAADVARMLALTARRARSHRHRRPRDRARSPTRGVEEIVVLGRRGPAQAAFTNPELRELGELERRRRDRRPGRGRARRGQPRLPRVRGRRPDRPRATSRSSPSSPQREPEGKPKRIVLRFLPLAGRDPGRRQGRVRSCVGRNELDADEAGAIRARDTGEREDDRVRPGAALDRLQGAGLEGVPFDERRGVIPNEGGRVLEPETGEPGPRPLRGRLDQARPVRRDRHEQEGRAGDGRHDLLEDLERRRTSRTRAERAGASRGRGADRGAARRARRRPRHLLGLAGDRRAPSSRRRRAARPPAGQVLSRRRDARGGAIGRGIADGG